MKLDFETIDKIVTEAAMKTGIPKETMEKAWDALCVALEPFVRQHYQAMYESTYVSNKPGKA